MKKITFLFFLSIVLIFLSSCNSDGNEIKKTEDKNEASTGAIEPDYFHVPLGCVSTDDTTVITEIDLIDSFNQGFAGYDFQGFYNLFEEKAFTDLIPKTQEFWLCILDYHSLGFVSYGDFGKFNNAIGYYNLDKGLIIDFKFSKDTGDRGVCRINGFIDNEVIYSCNGGDGPFGFKKIFLLEENGKSKLIKDCEFNGEYSNEQGKVPASEKCTVDLFAD